MIQVDTIADFYFDLNTSDHYEDEVKNYLTNLQGKMTAKEIIRVAEPFKSNVGLTSRVTVRLILKLEESRECRHIDDYAGKVFPFLKKHLKGELITTRNTTFKYIRAS
ncbi:hypothetical protein LGQ02_12140 [Bacillus shivajii]|uniref:hypothetical protein n=1 Tax=Bacillus shivajii TaxID=1983719 RepID=UPI001CF935D4|nr:hypothetical protein [Bacillus shivajii]UCZ51615.1 hypothetical protein LGQ02_12140 [Bacillus shivajii]